MRIRLRLGIEMPGPAPVKVAADESSVGEPAADEPPGPSDADSDPVALGTIAMVVAVSVAGVTSALVLVEPWSSSEDISEASVVGPSSACVPLTLLSFTSSVGSAAAGSRTGSAVA